MNDNGPLVNQRAVMSGAMRGSGDVSAPWVEAGDTSKEKAIVISRQHRPAVGFRDCKRFGGPSRQVDMILCGIEVGDLAVADGSGEFLEMDGVRSRSEGEHVLAGRNDDHVVSAGEIHLAVLGAADELVIAIRSGHEQVRRRAVNVADKAEGRSVWAKREGLDAGRLADIGALQVDVGPDRDIELAGSAGVDVERVRGVAVNHAARHVYESVVVAGASVQDLQRLILAAVVRRAGREVQPIIAIACVYSIHSATSVEVIIAVKPVDRVGTAVSEDCIAPLGPVERI